MCAEKRKSPAPSGHLKRRAFDIDIQTDFPSTVLSALPNSYEFVSFTDLAPYDSYENKCILGRIANAYPVKDRPKCGHLRKLLLEDAYKKNGYNDENEARLTVFLFDEFAEASANYGVGSMLAVSNFHTESLTYEEPDSDFKLLPIQVLVMVSPSGDEGPNIWVAHKKIVHNGNGSIESKIAHSTEIKSEEEMEVEEDEEEDYESVENVNGAPVPETSRRSYHYTKLENIKDSKGKAVYNVYGVVERSKVHLNKMRKSYSLHLRISDETLSDFPCTILGGRTEVPVDADVGDVIRIHRMVVETVRGKLRGSCLSPKFIVVFDKHKKEPRSVAKTYVYTNEDKAEVRRLFSWTERTKKKLISEIKMDEFADFICQVIGVYIAKGTNAVVLTVWDGTKTTEFKSEHRGYPDEKIDYSLFDVARDRFVTLFVFGNYGLVAGDLQPGAYIEVKDAQLHCPKSNPDHPRLTIHPQQKDRRGIFVLDPTDERLAVLKRRLKKIADDVNQDPNRKNPDGDNFFLNCNLSGSSSPRKNQNLVASPMPSSSPPPAHKRESSPSVIENKKGNQDHSSETVVERSTSQEPTDEPSGFTGNKDAEVDIMSIPGTSGSGMAANNSARSSGKDDQIPVDEESGVSSQNVPEERTLSQKEFSAPQASVSGSDETVQKDRSHTEQTLSSDHQKSSSTGTVSSTLVTTEPQISSTVALQSEQPKLDTNGEIVSVLKAGVEPGQSTQEFGGVYKEMKRPLLSSAANSALGTVPSRPPTNQNSDNLARPTQFAGFGPTPKYSLFGQPSRQHETERVMAVDEWWKNVQTVTVTLGHSNVKPSTLVEVVEHSVPYKFRVIAAALKMKPETTSIRKLVRLYCPRCHFLTEDADPILNVAEEKNSLAFYLCPQCSASSVSSSSGQTVAPLLVYTYLVTFSLHDGSEVNIDAFLWKENAIKFFCGVTPEEALSDRTVADSILSMLWKVCPNARPSGSVGSSQSSKFSFYPTVDCCLMSYTAGGVTRYQMFDTAVRQ